MSEILPDCMMPDGAEPCKGHQELYAKIERLRSEKRVDISRCSELEIYAAKLETRIAELEAVIKEDVTRIAADGRRIAELETTMKQIIHIPMLDEDFGEDALGIAKALARAALEEKP